MKCEKCGNEIPDGQLVCLICGAEAPKKQNQTEEQESENNSKNEKVKPKQVRVKKDYTSLILVLGLFLVLVISIVLGFLVYYKVYVTPKTIFMDSLDTIYSKSLLPMSNIQNSGEYNIRYGSNKKVDSLDEFINFFSKINFSTDMTVDYSNSQFSGDITFNYGENPLFVNKVYGKDKEIYIKNSTTDKYVRMNNTYSDYIQYNTQQMKAYKKVLKEIKNALSVSLKEDYFKSEKSYININGVSHEVNNNELVINGDNIKEIEHGIVKYLYNSKGYISSLSRLTSKKSKEIKKELKRTLSDLEKEGTTVKFNTIVINIYTEGFKQDFLKLSIKQVVNSDEIVSVTRDDNQDYNIQLKLDDISRTIKIHKTEIPEKKSYDIDYSNGFDSVQLKIEYIFNRNNKKIESANTNVIDYQRSDEGVKKSIRGTIINELVENSFNTDKKQFSAWYNEIINNYKPIIKTVKKKKNKTNNSTNNNTNTSSDNQGNDSNQNMDADMRLEDVKY